MVHYRPVKQLRAYLGHKEVKRFLRFAVVGAIGSVIDIGSLTIFKEVFHLDTLIANTTSFLLGTINNYTLNRLWTFKDTRKGSVIGQFVQYASVSAVGLLLNDLLVTSLEGPLGLLFGSPERGYLPAKIFATGVVLFWNFLGNRFWTFRHQ